jgi:hypothetical protein
VAATSRPRTEARHRRSDPCSSGGLTYQGPLQKARYRSSLLVSGCHKHTRWLHSDWSHGNAGGRVSVPVRRRSTRAAERYDPAPLIMPLKSKVI